MFDQQSPRSATYRDAVLQWWDALDRGWKAALFGILIVLPHLSGVLP
ncbi:hypothetical protein ACFQJ5_06245 [Halomicroarcula sp. GCM10025324]|nr:hypothetical protein [Halomicroarcula sp. ZS-22-S1]